MKPGLSELFDDLKEGLESGITHVQGQIHLPKQTITLPPPPPLYTAEHIRSLRQHLGLTQVTFSQVLNVSVKTVQSWEQGERTPAQSALRLLQLLEEPSLLAALAR